MVSFVGPIGFHTDICSLLASKRCQFDADLLEMQSRHHLIEMLGQDLDLVVVLIALLE